MGNLNEGEREFVQKLTDAGYPQVAALVKVGMETYWPRRYDTVTLALEWSRILRLAREESEKR
jgi:hypothetical protein